MTPMSGAHSGNGQFSTFNEAEYTPSLTAWAARQGYGILAIPRLPPITTSGDLRPAPL